MRLGHAAAGVMLGLVGTDGCGGSRTPGAPVGPQQGEYEFRLTPPNGSVVDGSLLVLSDTAIFHLSNAGCLPPAQAFDPHRYRATCGDISLSVDRRVSGRPRLLAALVTTEVTTRKQCVAWTTTASGTQVCALSQDVPTGTRRRSVPLAVVLTTRRDDPVPESMTWDVPS